MRALGKHKLLASYSASTNFLKSKAAAKSALFVSETQTLWSQTNYNLTVFTVNNHSVQNVVDYKITTALFRTLFEHNK